jgi:chaperonin GroES
MSSIRPLSNKVLVLPDPVKEKTENGIILTAPTDEPRTGTVRKVGSGVVHVSDEAKWCRVPLEVQEGDRILYPPMDFPMIETDGEVLALMTEEQIIAIL